MITNIFENIKEIPIEDVVIRYLPELEFRTSGGRLAAKCPFHGDNHASFYAYIDTNSFYCFGCNRGGSVIDLVMEAKNLSTAWEAAKELAREFNVPFQEFTEEEKAEHQKHISRQELLTKYINWAQKQLSQDQREALRKRGLTDETIEEYRIGFDPGEGYKPQGDRLANFKKLGFITEKGFYLPGGRIIIPVFQHGKPVYIIFWDWQHTEASEMPKYFYPTGMTKPLVGLDLIRNDKPIHLVEGVFDWLSMRQAGYLAVCTLGTSVKEECLERLKRASQIYVMFDNDKKDDGSNPGQEKAAGLLKELYPQAKNILLPEGKDPNDCYRQSPKGFNRLIDRLTSEAKDAAELTLEEIKLPSNAAKIEQLKNEFLSLIACLDSETAKDIWVDRLYQKLKLVGVTRKSLQKELASKKQKAERKREARQPEQALPEIYKEWTEQINRTGRYLIAAPGILCFVKYSANGDKEQIPIANFVARPTRQTIRDNGIEIDIRFKLKGIRAGGHLLSEIAVSAEKFSSMNWVTGAWGMEANIEPGIGARDRVRHAIQMLAGGAKKEVVYTHLGWRKINNQWVYLHAGGAVGVNNVKVDLLEDKLGDYILPDTVGDIQENARIALKLLDVAKPEITFPLLAYVFLAPLCEPLRGAKGGNAKSLEPSCPLWLLGESGSLKTTITALYNCFFGRFSEQNLLASFKDTPSSLEKKAFLVKDSVLVVDDYHPAENRTEAQKIRTNAQMILRSYGDHSGRSRMKADTSLRVAYIPRGLCVITGEDLPGAGVSTIARFLTVEVKKGDINIELLTEAQANAGAYACVMRGYIEYLAGQMNKLPDQLSGDFFGYREHATKTGQHLRLPEAVSWLCIGLDKALEYFERAEALDGQRRDELFKQGWDIFLDMAEKQATRLIEEKPTEKFLRALNDLLTAEVIYTKHIYNSAEPAGSQAVFVGWHDDDWLYLLPEITYREVVKLYTAQGRMFPATQKILWRHLEEENLIAVERHGETTRRTVRETIDGKQRRVLKLRAAATAIRNQEELDT